MEFDDRLQRAFESLTERLRQEIAAQLTVARSELSEAAEADRQAAVAEAIRDAVAATERDASARIAESAGQAGVEARTAAAAQDQAASERLVEAIRTIDSARSLSEILDALLSAVAAEVARAAVLLPQGTTLKFWRLAGFDGATPNADAGLPLAKGGIAAEAAGAGHLVLVDTEARHALLPAFVELPDQARAIAVPLVISGQVLAVLYADEGQTATARQSWPAAVEVLARHAARALEAVTVSRLVQAEAFIGS
jgi:transcriptional regulator with GAF, ATPase, and Fis domain